MTTQDETMSPGLIVPPQDLFVRRRFNCAAVQNEGAVNGNKRAPASRGCSASVAEDPSSHATRFRASCFRAPLAKRRNRQSILGAKAILGHVHTHTHTNMSCIFPVSSFSCLFAHTQPGCQVTEFWENSRFISKLKR